MNNVLTCRCPNRPEVSAIAGFDLYEKVSYQVYIFEVSEKISHRIQHIDEPLSKRPIFGVTMITNWIGIPIC